MRESSDKNGEGGGSVEKGQGAYTVQVEYNLLYILCSSKEYAVWCGRWFVVAAAGPGRGRNMPG